MRPWTLTRKLERILKRAGLSNIRFHDLRHATLKGRSSQVRPRVFGARHNLDHLRQVLSRHTRHGRSDKEGHGRRPVVAYCCPTAAKGSQRGYQSLSLLLVFPANDRLFLVGAVGLEPTLYGFYVRDGHLSPRVGSYREMLCLQVFRKSESANTCRCMPLRVGPVVVSSVPIQLRCPPPSASVGDRVIDALPRSLRLRHEEDGRAQQDITNGTELRV
jgi:hypothetical protein